MTDDIVTRLHRHDHDWLPDVHTPCDYCDALYEIERLRQHMDILVDHNVELMDEVASLKAAANGQFSSTTETIWKRDV